MKSAQKVIRDITYIPSAVSPPIDPRLARPRVASSPSSGLTLLPLCYSSKLPGLCKTTRAVRFST